MSRFLLAVIFAATSHATVSVSELDADPQIWTGRDVVVTGEVVGDYSPRSDVVWVQLNDDAYVIAPLAERETPSGVNSGIGVRIPAGLFDEAWGAPGGYDVRGPILEVEAVFRYNSADDQGDTFLDATAIRLIEPARPIEQRPASAVRMLIGVGLTVGAAGLWWARRRRSPTSRWHLRS